jgi:hypothetical protein
MIFPVPMQQDKTAGESLSFSKSKTESRVFPRPVSLARHGCFAFLRSAPERSLPMPPTENPTRTTKPSPRILMRRPSIPSPKSLSGFDGAPSPWHNLELDCAGSPASSRRGKSAPRRISSAYLDLISRQRCHSVIEMGREADHKYHGVFLEAAVPSDQAGTGIMNSVIGSGAP